METEICAECGQDLNYVCFERRGAQFVGKYWCGSCKRKLTDTTPGVKLTNYGRFKKILARRSRARILSPREIEDAAAAFAIAIGSGNSWSTVRGILPPWYQTGMYKGEPLALRLTAEGVYNPAYERMVDFWSKVESSGLKKLTTPISIELGVLLTLLGARNAIRNC